MAKVFFRALGLLLEDFAAKDEFIVNEEPQFVTDIFHHLRCLLLYSRGEAEVRFLNTL